LVVHDAAVTIRVLLGFCNLGRLTAMTMFSTAVFFYGRLWTTTRFYSLDQGSLAEVLWFSSRRWLQSLHRM